MDVQEIFWLFVNPLQAIRGVRDFLELGGDVLLLIMITTFVLWGLIFERYAYFRKEFVELTNPPHKCLASPQRAQKLGRAPHSRNDDFGCAAEGKRQFVLY